MPENVIRFASTAVSIGNDVIGRVTQFGRSITISEEMISGSEDTTTGNNAILEKYIPVSVGETANIAGTSVTDDTGQIAVEVAARNATEGVVIEFRRPDGSGIDYTGFFTNFEENGELSANVYRYTAQFRVNDVDAVAAPS